MFDLTYLSNLFYPFAKRIWLCIHLNNVGKYYDNTCMRILRTQFGRREAPSAKYVHYIVKKVKESPISIDKPKREKPKTVRTRILLLWQKVCVKRHQHQLSSTIEYFGDIIETSFT